MRGCLLSDVREEARTALAAQVNAYDRDDADYNEGAMRDAAADLLALLDEPAPTRPQTAAEYIERYGLGEDEPVPTDDRTLNAVLEEVDAWERGEGPSPLKSTLVSALRLAAARRQGAITEPTDEREALADLIDDTLQSLSETTGACYKVADALLAAGFRRQVPVTDDECNDAALFLLGASAVYDREGLRAALEEARRRAART